MDRYPIDRRRITRETLDQLARVGRGKLSTPSHPPIRGFAPNSFKPRLQGDEITSEDRPRQLGGDPSAAVALEEAPEHFFDQDQWNDLLASCGSHEAALRRISDRDPGVLVLLWQQVAEQSTSASVKAREEERIYRLSQIIVAKFVSRLTKGEGVATGFQPLPSSGSQSPGNSGQS